MRASLTSRAAHAFGRMLRDARGASAVEFALVSLPLILMLMMILQMGFFYMAKASLDDGVVHAADQLVNNFNQGTAPPSGATLKTWVVSNSGGMIHNDTTLAVDLRLLTALALAVVPITDGQVDPSTSNAAALGSGSSILVLRAQASVPVFIPGMSFFAYVRSSAIVRRQS